MTADEREMLLEMDAARELVREAEAAMKERCIQVVEALADKVGAWANTDGPESVAALKEDTYRNAASALRALE